MPGRPPQKPEGTLRSGSLYGVLRLESASLSPSKGPYGRRRRLCASYVLFLVVRILLNPKNGLYEVPLASSKFHFALLCGLELGAGWLAA